MRRLLLAALIAASCLAAARPLHADQDPIPPTTLVFGQTLDLWFPNIVHPDPSRKVLQFVGEAQSFGPAGMAAILGIHFDYIDNSGVTQIVPAPNFYQIAIQPGGPPIPINAGPVVLDYCPETVSIHFENLSEGTQIIFHGIYDHTCVIIPEPHAAALAAAGVALLAAGRRRR